MPDKILTPEEQLGDSLNKFAQLGSKSLSGVFEKKLKLSPETAKVVTGLVATLVVAGLTALLKKLDEPAVEVPAPLPVA